MRVPPGARPLRSWDPGHVVTARMRRRPSPGGHLPAGARDCSRSSGGPGESGGRGPGHAALGGRAPFRSRSGVGRHAVPRHTGLGGRPSCAHQPHCAPVTPPGRTVWPARSWPPQLGAAALGGGARPRVRRTQGDSPRRPPAPRRLRSFLSNALPGPAPRRRPCGLHSRRFGCPTASRWPVFSPQKRRAEPWAPDGPRSRAGARWPRGWTGQELRVAPGKPSPSPPGVPGALSFSPGRQKGQLKGTAVGLPQATSDFAA